ncbi:MAG: hypothetical protein U5O39_00395 [Gammaproteobacteria bacterium]|nr:hypothetical protein [Gammaproteobacteria bacterium]
MLIGFRLKNVCGARRGRPARFCKSENPDDITGDIVGFFAERFNRIFDTVGGEVDQAFDRFTQGMSSKDLVQSIDSVTQAAFRLAGVADTVDTSIVNATVEAIEHHNRVQSDAMARLT